MHSFSFQDYIYCIYTQYTKATFTEPYNYLYVVILSRLRRDRLDISKFRDTCALYMFLSQFRFPVLKRNALETYANQN
jgi:hypothetical protein